MSHKSNENIWQAAEPTLRHLNPVWRDVFKDVVSASNLFAGFPSVAIHMMITFYLMLIIVAMAAGSGGSSPNLMTFVLLWHVFAIPAWILKCLILKLCQSPFGMLLFFTFVLVLVFLFQKPLIMALTNIANWAKLVIPGMWN